MERRGHRDGLPGPAPCGVGVSADEGSPPPAFRPTHHWTDQKLKVHAFYCVVAFTLTALLQREVDAAGIELSVPLLLDELGGIREVQVLTQSRRGRPRTHRVHSELNDVQERLYDALQLERYL